MTTHPEQPNPPTLSASRPSTANARHDPEDDTWVGLTPNDQLSTDPVVLVFTDEEITSTGGRRWRTP